MTYKTEPLGDGRRIAVSPAHNFGTDAFLLAEFARPKLSERVCDLGTGCGIIPTLWLQRGLVESAVGVDLSREACELAAATAELNGETDKLDIRCADLRDLKSELPREKYDLVTCNPPYFTPSSGYIAPEQKRAQARSELSCTLCDVCAAGRYLLRYGGRLCVCYRPERLADLICEMRAAGIEPKRLRTVHQQAGSAPWLVLIEGKRGGKPGLLCEPPLYMKDNDGESSREIEEMYGSYRQGRNSK